MSRRRLPNRRRSETFDLDFDGRTYSVAVGYDPLGQAREIFASGAKVGSTMDVLLDDVGVTISLLLQSGVEPAALAASMGRADGRAASIVAALADLLARHAELDR